jgi:hypothetical protein
MGIDVHLHARMHIWPDAICRVDRDSLGMGSDTAMRRQSEAVTNLYDGACDLLYAAQQIREAASDRDATPAFAATIGCVDASLGALAQAVSAMSRAAVAELTFARQDGPDAAAVDVEREFAALAEAIRVAQAACDQTRERTAPTLAQLSLA